MFKNLICLNKWKVRALNLVLVIIRNLSSNITGTFQVRCSLMWTFKNLADLTCDIVGLSTCSEWFWCGSNFMCDRNSTKFVLSKLSENRLALNKSALNVNFWFAILNKSSIDLWDKKMLVSSANDMRLSIEESLGRSLI